MGCDFPLCKEIQRFTAPQAMLHGPLVIAISRFEDHCCREWGRVLKLKKLCQRILVNFAYVVLEF